MEASLTLIAGCESSLEKPEWLQSCYLPAAPAVSWSTKRKHICTAAGRGITPLGTVMTKCSAKCSDWEKKRTLVSHWSLGSHVWWRVGPGCLDHPHISPALPGNNCVTRSTEGQAKAANQPNTHTHTRTQRQETNSNRGYDTCSTVTKHEKFGGKTC